MNYDLKANTDIVTSCDEDYLFFLKNFSDNVHFVYRKKPYVYNLGIKKNSQKQIDAHYINLDTESNFKKINNENCIRAIHKPLCILDFIQKTKNQFIFIDTDCLFIKKIKKFEEDILFTYRIYSEQTKKDFQKNGRINSGVIFFKNDPNKKNDLRHFLLSWKQRCTSDPEITDQKALSDLLVSLDPNLSPHSKISYRSLSIQILRSEDYNDTKQSTGWIWHFKGAGRRADKKNKYIKTIKRIRSKYYSFLSAFYLQRYLFKIKQLLQPVRYKHRYRSAIKET